MFGFSTSELQMSHPHKRLKHHCSSTARSAFFCRACCQYLEQSTVQYRWFLYPTGIQTHYWNDWFSRFLCFPEFAWL